MDTLSEKKTKFHNVQALEFEGDVLILKVDNQVARIPISEVSPRLANASPQERSIYQVSPAGYGIHWPLIDEDLSVNGLLKCAIIAR